MEAYLQQQNCTVVRSFMSQENGGKWELFAECPCTPQGDFGKRKVPGKCILDLKAVFVPENKD
ncbi:hypothetical protein MEL_151b [Marseillevirus sp. 'Melbournevirus']|nr:hypothetical protein MEL_151b [Melbournevirus]